MNVLACAAGAAAFCSAIALGLGGGPVGSEPAGGEPPAIRLTTDTAEYCSHLATRLQDAERARPDPVPREVRALSVQGQAMCDHGDVRAGVLRLRRAMQLMMDPPGGR